MKWSPLAILVGLTACSSSAQHAAPSVAPAQPDATAPTTAGDAQPEVAPKEAYARGWMPLQSTGVNDFRKLHPTYDGRGVIIGILDSGIDPGIPGLTTTTTGERKILDLRDFSGEGAVSLEKVQPQGDTVVVAGKVLSGFSRVRTTNAAGPWYAGTLRELPLGGMPAGDLNGNRSDSDTLPVIVTRASDGWVLFADTDGDGSLSNERPVHDYLVGRETLAWSTGHRPPTATLAVNFHETKGAPALDLFFDTSSHGSHVAGIAAGHDLYGVPGFDGVAPGAQLLGLKIADDAEGGISTTGSMLEALKYAIGFAAQRHLPLVLNMSFGVGNEAEGRARIDELIDSVLAAHPAVVFAISAGNDGPGLSTMGFPGSASRVLTVGAVIPAVFFGQQTRTRPDPLADFSSRGGELAKPDIVTPGMAYSTVPRWNTGDERKSGTSMASPHAAGLAALLVSALAQRNMTPDARQIRQALMVTAHPVPGETYLDEGTGVPDINAALSWLDGSHLVPLVLARPADHGVTAAFRHDGLESPADTLQTFLLERPEDGTAPVFTLRSGAGWLTAPSEVTLHGSSTPVALRYNPDSLRLPGVYTGVVSGWGSDTGAGPAFRLVNTVVVPAAGTRIETDPLEILPGGQRRLYFHAQAGRPFFVATATTSRAQHANAYLHEPGGQPYLDGNGISAGAGEDAALYIVDGRDVVSGLYEAVTVTTPLQRATTVTVVEHSPVVIDAVRDPAGIVVSLQNVDSGTVTSAPFVVLVGEERRVTVVAHGSTAQSVPFTLPPWAVHATVDVTMDPAQWPIFTDFGLTLLDSGGRQLGKSPLNYARGRLNVDLPGEGPVPASVEVSPGLAEPASDARWTANISIRLYADSASVVRIPVPEMTVAPGATATARVALPPSPVALGSGFFPLGIVVVPMADRTWTREVGLAEPTPPPAP
jgi:tripeptidyl-peptidase II